MTTTVVSRQSSVGSRKSTVVGQQSTVVVCALVVAGAMFAAQVVAAPKYDLLLQGGHVIDPRNNVDAVRDVAISAGKIAAIAPTVDPADATKTIDARGLFVTPGVVDIHTHVYAGTGEVGSPGTELEFAL